MDPSFLGPLVPIAAIIAFAAVKIAKLRASPAASLPADVTARLEALEQRVDGLQHELSETHERLDFAERLLSQARDDRRIGGWTRALPWQPAHRTRSTSPKVRHIEVQ